MTHIHYLPFAPLWGLSSKHLQIFLSAYAPAGTPPPSKPYLVDIGNGDQLSCEKSTPIHWKKNKRTIVLVHGLGGSHTSKYMIRMARKLYQRGYQVVRINLRGCGTGAGLSKLPYCAGNSLDVLKVIQRLKKEAPESEITVIGFSLGGNIVLKLAGELGEEGKKLVTAFIAVCPPLDLEQTCRTIMQKKNRIYHHYYLKKMIEQGREWMNGQVQSLFEYDEKISGPLWGFRGALDYYSHTSCKKFLEKIRTETHLLFAEDDPFISMGGLEDLHLSDQVHVWVTKYGGHMGFIGPTKQRGNYFWMDELLLSWIESI